MRLLVVVAVLPEEGSSLDSACMPGREMDAGDENDDGGGDDDDDEDGDAGDERGL